MELHSHLSPLSRFTSRPCRCCGRSAEQVVVDEIRFFEGMLMRTLHQVTCRCGSSGPRCVSAAEAVAAWSGPEPETVRTSPALAAAVA